MQGHKIVKLQLYSLGSLFMLVIFLSIFSCSRLTNYFKSRKQSYKRYKTDNKLLSLMHLNDPRILWKCKHVMCCYGHNKRKLPIIKMLRRFRKLHMVQWFCNVTLLWSQVFTESTSNQILIVKFFSWMPMAST